MAVMGKSFQAERTAGAKARRQEFQEQFQEQQGGQWGWGRQSKG